MARAVITVDRLEHGDLPPICCKTGERTRLAVQRRHRVIPGWTWALLPLVIPFVVVALLSTRRTVMVSMPMSRRAARRLRTAERLAAGCLFLAVLSALLILAGATGDLRLPWAVPGGLFALTALARARLQALGLAWRLPDGSPKCTAGQSLPKVPWGWAPSFTFICPLLLPSCVNAAFSVRFRRA